MEWERVGERADRLRLKPLLVALEVFHSSQP
jgi:hypothetical protein